MWKVMRNKGKEERRWREGRRQEGEKEEQSGGGGAKKEKRKDRVRNWEGEGGKREEGAEGSWKERF